MEALSIRESQVIFEVIQGKGVKEVANDLHISFYTADSHLKNARNKTGARNMAELVKFYILQNKDKFFAIVFMTAQLLSMFGINENDIRRRKRGRKNAKITRVLKVQTKAVV